MHDERTGLPTSEATSIVSVKPLVFPVSGRGHDLHVRVSVPLDGTALPIVLFAHGFGSNLDGYAPLVDAWAAHGFVVIQATHLDSRRYGTHVDGAHQPDIWRHRVQDMVGILDQLDRIEETVPNLAGRVDRRRVVAAGHSFGGQTAGMLVGLRVTDPDTGVSEDLSDPRVMASLQLATAGSGGDDLSPYARDHLPWLRGQDFSRITAPGLVVAGDADELPLSSRGADWTTDPYTLSVNRVSRSLLIVHGGQHSLGGIAGYEAAETTDEDPNRVALIQQVTVAYLRHVTGIDHTHWRTTQMVLQHQAHPLGHLLSAKPAEPSESKATSWRGLG